jgi:serine/tyrosine/threonine adenylyltransferase
MDQAALEAPAALDLGPAWQHDFARLGPDFFTELRPTPLPDPHLVSVNRVLAGDLGLDVDRLAGAEGVAAFAGNQPLAGSRPLAGVYSGHQFGAWAGQLGDGRAILLGGIATPQGVQELQLKGAGRTPYSRGGDGRAVLRSSIREYLCSEAMHGLGIPTTRALLLTGSPQPVPREELETAAVVARVAPSFVRFGHFEHFAARGQLGALERLADYVIDTFYPQCRGGRHPGGNRFAALLEQVSERTAATVAQWQAAGFCHGVMNTDNMSILGLTLDYGPFQFMDAFVPGHVCNHTDQAGRYAYNRQPNVAYWNLYCLGQALLPLIGDEDLAVAALESYKTVFPRELEARMRARLGLAQQVPEDRQRIEGILALLAAGRVDWTIFWRRLAEGVAGGDLAPARDLFPDRAAFDAWARDYLERLAGEAGDPGERMLRTNPKFVLRNHLCELAIGQAKLGDFSAVETLLRLVQSPFGEHPGHEDLAGFPPDWAAQIEISCSS